MAPLPRPPQPMRPTLIVSPPAAWAFDVDAKASPAATAEDALRKSRRLDPFGSVMMRSPCGLRWRRWVGRSGGMAEGGFEIRDGYHGKPRTRRVLRPESRIRLPDGRYFVPF